MSALIKTLLLASWLAHRAGWDKWDHRGYALVYSLIVLLFIAI